jgi:hypothetical protein
MSPSWMLRTDLSQARDDASIDQTATRTGWYYAKKPEEGDVEKRHEEGEVGVDQTATRTGWYYAKKPEEGEVEKRHEEGEVEKWHEEGEVEKRHEEGEVDKRHEEGEVGVDQTATRTGWYYAKKPEEVTE